MEGLGDVVRSKGFESGTVPTGCGRGDLEGTPRE